MSVLDSLARYTPLTINIKGEVAFSHISCKYEGEELEKMNRKTVQNGGRAVNKPYCTITIANPEILNQESLPPEVVQVMNTRFKKDRNGVIKYFATSKSPNLPIVAYSAEAGPDYAGHGIADKDVHLPKELDTGLSVTIGARLFNTKMGVGLGIDYILINEGPVRYYEPNNLSNMLEAQGITYVAPAIENIGQPTTPIAVASMANLEQQTNYAAAITKDNSQTLQQQQANAEVNGYDMQSRFQNIPDEMVKEIPFNDQGLQGSPVETAFQDNMQVMHSQMQVNAKVMQSQQQNQVHRKNNQMMQRQTNIQNGSSPMTQMQNANIHEGYIYGGQRQVNPVMQYEPN